MTPIATASAAGIAATGALPRGQAAAAPPLTVAHAVADAWLDQTQTWLYNRVRRLPDSVTCHILCDAKRNLDQFPVPNIHALADLPRWRVTLDRGLRRARLRRCMGFAPGVLRRVRPDVLHSHFAWIGWEYCRVARRLGIPHVVSFYGLDVNFLPRSGWSKRYLEMFERIDAVVCEGPFMAECVAQLGCPRAKLHVHHLGVDMDEIEFRPRRWRAGEPLHVLIAASFREKKGIPYALEALGLLRREVPLEITIIGDAGAAPVVQAEKKRILETIERCELGPVTRMLGYQPHQVFFDEAYRSHVFLSPSVTAANGDTEGGAPVSLIEVAATGMMIVSTTHCDIPEVIRNGVGGLLAPERDSAALAEHLRYLVRNPDRWEPMARAGREHLEREFDGRVLGRRLAAFYAQLAADRGR